MYYTNSEIDSKNSEVEMLSFTPICTHENPRKTLFIGLIELPQEISNLVGECEFINKIDGKIDFNSESFDVIVADINHLNIQEVFRVLKKDGIFCMKVDGELKNKIVELGKFFRIVMPYHNMKLIFASNKYHPTADIILDRSDFLEETEYYNSEIHIASFALYQNAKKELKGVVKS